MTGLPNQYDIESRLPVAEALATAARRVDLTCPASGFEAPPVPIQMSFVGGTGRVSAVVLTPPGKADEAAEWIRQYNPSHIEIARGLTPKGLVATFDHLPPGWDKLVSMLELRYLELRPEGVLSLFIAAGRPETLRFVEKLPALAQPPRERKAIASRGLVPLTARQYEVLSLAVAYGYYELPHKLNVRDLAKKIGMSLGATSEVMRRGESVIMNNYFDTAAREQWERSHATALRERARDLVATRVDHAPPSEIGNLVIKHAG